MMFAYSRWASDFARFGVASNDVDEDVFVLPRLDSYVRTISLNITVLEFSTRAGMLMMATGVSFFLGRSGLEFILKLK